MEYRTSDKYCSPIEDILEGCKDLERNSAFLLLGHRGCGKSTLGEEHPATAASYNNLAGVYEAQGEYKKAEELYQKSLKIRKRILGEEHPDTVTNYK